MGLFSAQIVYAYTDPTTFPNIAISVNKSKTIYIQEWIGRDQVKQTLDEAYLRGLVEFTAWTTAWTYTRFIVY